MPIAKSVRDVEVVALKMDPPVVLDETASVRDVLRQMQEKAIRLCPALP